MTTTNKESSAFRYTAAQHCLILPAQRKIFIEPIAEATEKVLRNCLGINVQLFNNWLTDLSSRKVLVGATSVAIWRR